MSVCFQITLVRHGETDENRLQIIQGQRDTLLSETGAQQARLLSTRLSKETFTQVYSSDLIRAKATADIIVNKQRDVVTDGRLRERCFGVLEGCTISDLISAARRAGVRPAKHIPQGGETVQQLNIRAESFFSELCSHCSKHCATAPPLAHREDTILSQYLAGGRVSAVGDTPLAPSAHYLVVTHGGFMQAFIRHLQEQYVCDFPNRARSIPNTAVTSLLITLEPMTSQSSQDPQPPVATANDDSMRDTQREVHADKMPNTGMLDHIAYKPQGRKRNYTHWMGAWPSSAGYQTMKSYKVSSFSRHLISQAHKQEQQLRMSMSRPGSSIPRVAIGNSISPFHSSHMKPTCGFFFSRETCHRKNKIGIPPSNLVAWRSSHSAPARGRTA